MSDLDFPSPPIKTQKFKTKIREKSEGKEEGKDNFKFEFDFKGLDEFDLDSTLLKGKEEKKKPEQEMLPRNSGENRETASKSKNIVLSKPTDDISECSEIGAVPKAQTAMDSNFKLAERNLEWVEPPEGVTSCLAQSTCASGSQDAGNDPKKQKQTTVIKQDVVADACSFGNLLHTGDSNSMKDASIQECPDNVASSPASSFQSGSRDKLSLKSTPSEGKLGSKEPEEGDQCQCLAKIDSSHAEMPNFDSHSKNSIPTENEHSKCNLDTYKTDSILKNAAMSGIKKISSDKLNTMVREDMDDNIRGEINQCQNQEALGKDQNTPSKNPFSTMQRSEVNPAQSLSKMGQMPPSTANSGNKAVFERICTAPQSVSNHQSQKSVLGVAKITEPGMEVGKHPLKQKSRTVSTGTKSTSMSPCKYSLNLPSLQVSRPMASNGESYSTLKQAKERLLSSSKTTINFSSNSSHGKKIQAFTDPKNKTLSPVLPLKRKPLEKSMAETVSMNPLKRVSGSPQMTEDKSNDTVRKSLSHPPTYEGNIQDRIYRKTPSQHTLSGNILEEKMPDIEKSRESVIQQQQILDSDREAEGSRSNPDTDQHLSPHLSAESYSRESDDVWMPENDETAEKADRCSRDLEDMCKMLKKKHEEAKDLLVRAIVNNNLLLMLNHPLHEEKVQVIQKYVAYMFLEECGK